MILRSIVPELKSENEKPKNRIKELEVQIDREEMAISFES